MPGDNSEKHTGTGKCGKGQIERVGYSYVRKKTQKKVSVPATCVSDKGKPGKGPKLITIPEYDVGLLSKYGYSLAENHERRVNAIKKAIKQNSELKILRHLNALRTLLKSSPKLYSKLDKDMKWIQKDYATRKGGKNDLLEDWEKEEMDELEMKDKEWYENDDDDEFMNNKHMKEDKKEMKEDKKEKKNNGKNKMEQKAGQEEDKMKLEKKSSKKASKKGSKKGGDKKQPRKIGMGLADNSSRTPWSLVNFGKPEKSSKKGSKKGGDKKHPWSLVNFNNSDNKSGGKK